MSDVCIVLDGAPSALNAAMETIKNRDGARARRDARESESATRRDATRAMPSASARNRGNSASAMDYLRHTRPGFPSGLEVRRRARARRDARRRGRYPKD
jgi:hypothetical protein